LVKQQHIFYGWWLVVGLFIIGMLGPIGRFSMTAFIPFIIKDLGWSRATIGFAQSLTLWMYAIFVLLSGYMVDKIGGRKTFLIGGITTLAGWMLLSTVKSPWQLYLYYGVLMALAVSMTHYVPSLSTSRKWFRKRAGLVAGVIASAWAAGSAIFMPVMTGLADSHGWRYTSLVCGICFSVVIILLAFFIVRDSPESMGLHPDDENMAPSSGNLVIKETSWTVKEAIKTSQLWLLFTAYSVSSIGVSGVLAHIVMWGVDLGSPEATAGIFVTAFTAPFIISTVGGGWLGDRYGRKRLMLIGLTLSAFAMVYGWQVARTQESLMAFAIFIALSHGLQIALYVPYLGDLFGRAHIGSLFSIITLGYGLIGGSGPFIWGKVFDVFGNYNVACLICVPCYAIAAIAIFLVHPLEAGRSG